MTTINNEYRFGTLPSTKLPRSVFKMKKNWKGTFNVGYAIPFYVQQLVVPGDTFKIKQSIVARMLTPIHPTMDDLVLDIYYFAVPWRLVWTNFKKFMGENTSGAWTQTAELEIPQITVASTTGTNSIPKKGSIWDYFGLPKNIKGSDANHPVSVSALPFRAYWEVYDYFIRNQNLIAPVAIAKTDSNKAYANLYSEGLATPAKMSKLPSYFTTCLPEPIKGGTNGHIPMPLGTKANIVFPSMRIGIKGNGMALGLTDGTNEYGLKYISSAPTGLIPNTGAYGQDAGESESGSSPSNTANIGVVTNKEYSGLTSGDLAVELNNKGIYADLTTATASTIQALRLAAQTEMIYSRDGVFGTRYFDEILYGHYGVTSGAAKYEKPLYIGGKRIPIVMNQVAQTSATDPNTSPQGNVAAFSLTADVDHIVTQSFTEHTILLGILCVRQLEHTSQQNIPRQWSMKKRLDMWWHEYDHLGPQPVYNKEIYADGSLYDEEVFGYQERFAEYRYEENVISGEFNSTYSAPLDSWHYGDIYDSLPVLSKQWIEETDANVQRSLAVQNHDQFMVDTTLYIKATRPLPVSGMIGGLIDHF